VSRYGTASVAAIEIVSQTGLIENRIRNGERVATNSDRFTSDIAKESSVEESQETSTFVQTATPKDFNMFIPLT